MTQKDDGSCLFYSFFFNLKFHSLRTTYEDMLV